MARVVFLGTPQAAVPSLHELTRHHEVVSVITQPDRPKGRSGRPVPPPVKTAAIDLGLAVAQPQSRGELTSAVSEAGPVDIGVVVAFGRILGREALEIPSHGMVNAHFSLLPRWRGAAPVERALLAGDPMTGVTIIRLDEGLDTGQVLTAQAVDIEPDENGGELTRRLADLAARLLGQTLGHYLTGDLVPVGQTDEGATYADKLTAQDRSLDAGGDVSSFVSRVRALAPEPGATLQIDGDPIQVLAVRRHHGAVPVGHWRVVDGAPVVGVSDGSVELLVVKRPGKRTMDGMAWVRGLRKSSGAVA